MHWTAQCEEAFQILKRRLRESPVLKVADFNKPFVVQIDASDVGIGAVFIKSIEMGMSIE